MQALPHRALHLLCIKTWPLCSNLQLVHTCTWRRGWRRWCRGCWWWRRYPRIPWRLWKPGREWCRSRPSGLGRCPSHLGWNVQDWSNSVQVYSLFRLKRTGMANLLNFQTEFMICSFEQLRDKTFCTQALNLRIIEGSLFEFHWNVEIWKTKLPEIW